MYEKFTDRARKAMQLANREAQDRNCEYIGTNHVLCGLLKEGTGVACELLKGIGVDFAALLAEAERPSVTGTADALGAGRVELAGAKRAIEFAMQEARSLKHDYVGTEHILLGLLRLGEGQTAAVLAAHRLEHDHVRAALELRLASGQLSVVRPPQRTPQTTPRVQPISSRGGHVSLYRLFNDRARRVMQSANKEAMRLRHEYIGTEHLLLGLIAEESSFAVAVLTNLDIDPPRIRRAIEKLLQNGPDAAPAASYPHTPRAKKVIEYAIEESRRMQHDYIGSGHLLVGLLREQEGIAAQVLMNEGLTLEAVRGEIIRLLNLGIREMSASIAAKGPLVRQPRQLEDLPEEVKPIVAELDVDIEQRQSAKEEAVAAQRFEEAAVLRDETAKLQSERRRTIRDWAVNYRIETEWLSRNDATVHSLAHRIAEQCSWEALPELADALEQAGCDDARLLAHCRQDGPHAEHCWVVDLLLASVEPPDVRSQ